MPVPELARERLKRIFRFLQALDQHRNPAKRRIDEQLWMLWLNRLPKHETIEFEYPIDMAEAELDEPGMARESAGSSGDENGSSVVLRVCRPKLTKCPEPPAGHLDWISGDWQDPSIKVELLQVLETEGEDAELLFEASRAARLEDNPERVSALRQWIVQRQRWADVEINARKTMTVFQKLYALHGTIAREGEQVELMLGDGILNWRQPGGGVHHPVLLQRVELHFDPALPQFEVLEGDSPVELYTSPLRSSGDVEGLKLAELRRELETGGFYPLHGDSTSAFLKGLANRLADGGEFVEDGAPRGEMDHPRIGRDPVLFLRRRVLGFAQAIEAVLEDLDECEDVPEPLIQVAGIDNDRSGTEEPVVDDATVRRGLEPEDILLSKLANPEQIRVAQRLQGQNSVVVQGPPGTGKTHTIANLIGHLLAQGKSILVTAHTAKALAVLRDQVVEPLQPLCVSVLGNDTESRKQMAASVEQIVERLSSSDEENLRRRAAGHQKRRRELLEELSRLKQELVTCRAAEFTPIVLAGRSYQPSAAARMVSAEAEIND